MHKRTAFTLAEVAITLTIIAIVAIITVPAIVTKYQQRQTVVKLEKVYSTFSNALNMAVAAYGSISSWELGTTGNKDDAYSFAQKYIFPYVQLSKDCGLNSEGDCEHSYYSLNSVVPTLIDNTHIRYFLSDGTFIAQRVVNPGGSRAGYIRTVIDINGHAGPNVMGKDVFEVCIFIKSTNASIIGRFVDWGYGLTREQLMVSSGGGCNRNGQGWYCLSLIMLDGWKISDDYPW